MVKKTRRRLVIEVPSSFVSSVFRGDKPNLIRLYYSYDGRIQWCAYIIIIWFKTLLINITSDHKKKLDRTELINHIIGLFRAILADLFQSPDTTMRKNPYDCYRSVVETMCLDYSTKFDPYIIIYVKKTDWDRYSHKVR